MAQVAITVLSKTYRLVCDDGDEDRLAELAQYVKAKIEAVRVDVGNAGDERLVLMAALLIADELFDAQTSVKASAQTSNDGHVDVAVQRLRSVASSMEAGNANAAHDHISSGQRRNRESA